jgi:carbonic anhydrase/acetyltransferase-like protein (isoleucine patch superfamily)
LIYTLGELAPNIADDVFIADNAVVIGSVSIASQSSVWFGTVLRGDNDVIQIGERSNVQDGSVIHVDEGVPTRIGNDVSIGHNAMIHGCTIGDGSLIGIASIILDFAIIGRHSLVGANSLITEGKEFPDRVLILGSPARVIRELTDQEVLQLQVNADHYVKKSRNYQSRLLLRTE